MSKQLFILLLDRDITESLAAQRRVSVSGERNRNIFQTQSASPVSVLPRINNNRWNFTYPSRFATSVRQQEQVSCPFIQLPYRLILSHLRLSSLTFATRAKRSCREISRREYFHFIRSARNFIRNDLRIVWTRCFKALRREKQEMVASIQQHLLSLFYAERFRSGEFPLIIKN